MGPTATDNNGRRWQRAEDREELALRACRLILDAAEKAIAARGKFTIVLAGGRTPERTYELLSEARSDWHRWHVYFGDERCRPTGDALRNSVMAAGAWLDKVPVPDRQIHAIPAERGARAAARAYEPLVRRALPFDLAVLGLGNDGHTASLFPGRALRAHPLVQPVLQAPKPPARRVTLSAAAFNRSRRILVLVSGGDKAAALAAWRRGRPLPIAAVQAQELMTVLYDRSAGAALED